MATDPKVVDRIKKLLARATSSEPHEAALAREGSPWKRRKR